MKYVERKLYRPTHLALLPMTTWNSLKKKYSIKEVKKHSDDTRILLCPQ